MTRTGGSGFNAIRSKLANLRMPPSISSSIYVSLLQIPTCMLERYSFLRRMRPLQPALPWRFRLHVRNFWPRTCSWSHGDGFLCRGAGVTTGFNALNSLLHHYCPPICLRAFQLSFSHRRFRSFVTLFLLSVVSIAVVLFCWLAICCTSTCMALPFTRQEFGPELAAGPTAAASCAEAGMPNRFQLVCPYHAAVFRCHTSRPGSFAVSHGFSASCLCLTLFLIPCPKLCFASLIRLHVLRHWTPCFIIIVLPFACVPFSFHSLIAGFVPLW